jgi:hypothetical protein
VKILCHRGRWATRSEQNTLEAFEAAWDRGWGIETDVRDRGSELLISHDSPTGDQMSLGELLDAWTERGGETPIALNVKADGLGARVATTVEEVAVDPLFVFDMSVPDLVAWTSGPGAAVPAYTRWSDLEPDPVLLDRTRGLWLDAFTNDFWWSPADLAEHLEAGRGVVIVSPELHGRQPDAHWAWLAGLDIASHPGLAICTDDPEGAERCFR